MKQGRIISRRSFLKGSAGIVGAGALAMGFGAGSLIKPRKVHAQLGYLPYTTLDVEEVRKLAWKHYFNSGG
jgi:anaerobic selenocysteine-containing dehydrogenase